MNSEKNGGKQWSSQKKKNGTWLVAKESQIDASRKQNSKQNE